MGGGEKGAQEPGFGAQGEQAQGKDEHPGQGRAALWSFPVSRTLPQSAGKGHLKVEALVSEVWPQPGGRATVQHPRFSMAGLVGTQAPQHHML